tara:strand:- start:2712 stop:3323 length:612 start_codon:yes stop_codon:yes gene_type:complete
MPDGLVKMSDQFGGLPMDQLIGGPLSAACNAQVLLAKASSDFIKNVGLNEDGNTARTVDFSFTKPVQDADGTSRNEEVNLEVPLLAIINTPSLSVKECDVRFTMEVKSSTSSKTTSDSKADLTAHAKYNAGFFSCDVTVHGSVANHSENARSSDNSAKYDVKVVARDDGPPEGLMRVLDMLQDAIAPRPDAGPPPVVNPPKKQ